MAGVAIRSARSSVRSASQNLIGIAVVSVLLCLTFVPIALTLPFGTLAVVGGLWATCLLNGLVLVATFRYTSTLASRQVFVRTRRHVRFSETYRTGLSLGVVTFAVALVGVVVLFAPTAGVFRWTSVGIALSLLVLWYALTALSSPELGRGDPLHHALRMGLSRFSIAPVASIWFLVASFVLFVLTGITVVTVVVILPGSLALLASSITHTIDVRDRE